MILLRYFSREVFTTTLAIAGIVLVISVGWRFSGYLDSAAAGNLASEILFALMAYRLPGFLELIIPVSFFLGIMLVYGRLHVDNEMIVLHSSGMSHWQLTGLTLTMAAVVMVITAMVSLWLKPMGEHEVEALLSGQKNLTEFDTLAPGRFQTLSSGQRVTYTKEITKDGHLSGVFINDYQDSPYQNAPPGSVTVIAESGQTQVDEDGRRFLVLQDGKRYRGRPGDRDYQVISYQEYGQLVESAGEVKIDKRRAAIPTLDLLTAEEPVAVSELHWRISMVLIVPIIALLAIPLSRVSPRQGRFNRLVPAMILCFVYIVSLSAARSALERGDVPLEFGLWWVHGIFLLITAMAFEYDRLSLWFTRLVSSPQV